MTVLGSANIDLVLAVERYPGGGETVTADHRGEVPGGKGLNQAVAAARAGARTAFVGAVGEDSHGRALLATMTAEGIGTDAVRTLPTPTGMAVVVLHSSGENTIYVLPGANAEVALDDTAAATLRAGRVLVAQLEVPVPAVAATVAAARDAGVQVVFNAAPAVPLPEDLLRQVDVLVVNEHEASLLGGSADPVAAATALSRLARQTVVTLGAQGAALVSGDGSVSHESGLPADVVDTTGAGDTFVGVLAAALAEGAELREAVRRGVAAGAVAVERLGAVPSIPTRAQTDARLAGAR